MKRFPTPFLPPIRLFSRVLPVLALWLALLALLALSGCASTFGGQAGTRQTGSVVDYLYPDAREAPRLATGLTRLRLPVRVGIAFVPGHGRGADLSEAARTRLLERVKAAFAGYDYIAGIEIVPAAYLRPRGGFDNLDQVGRMLDIDVIALVSHDQVRFNDSNRLAVLYWTVVGAYLVKGDQYDVQTMVDAAVFDIRSRRLLFRAPGSSQVKGAATLAGYGRELRDAQSEGYRQAVDQMIPQLQAQLAGFERRARAAPGIELDASQYRGGRGAGALGWTAALLAAAAAWGLGRRHA